MKKEQAMQNGYQFSGVYSWDKDEVKARIKEERKKGNKAILVTVPPNKLSRGHHGTGYSMYIIKSDENVKAEKILKIKSDIVNLEEMLKKKRLEATELEKRITTLYSELNTVT